MKSTKKNKKEQSVSLKGLLDDLENVGISLGTHLSDQTKKNINIGGYFVNVEGSTTVYHGTQKLDLKVEDLESGHIRVDGNMLISVGMEYHLHQQMIMIMAMV